MTRLYKISPTKPASIVHFDWLTVVFPVGQTEAERLGQDLKSYIWSVLANYGLDSLVYEPLRHGLYLYDNAEATGNNSIIVAWYNTDDKGDLSDEHCTFCLQMSGAGVETLESVLANVNLTVADFIKGVTDEGATFSRVDACNNFFNYGKEYSAKYVGEQCAKGNLVSRASHVKTISSYDSDGEPTGLDSYTGASEGFTTYIGKNPKQIRVYNKLAERSEKVNLLYQVKSWSRWEFQLNGIQAQGFIENYLDRDCDLAQTWTDWLATNYRFVTKHGRGIRKQAKRSRYPDASWYKTLVKTARDKTVVRTEKQKPTFEREANWLKKQVYPTLASIYQARVEKYVQNGVAYEDARRLALEKVQTDIDEVALNQAIDWTRVSTWLAEEGEKV